jgi:(p)ppGpp synthase/HD superfamily hydrolase
MEAGQGRRAKFELVDRRLNNVNFFGMNIIMKAATLAVHYHKHHVRHSGVPYMTHIWRVAGRVATISGMGPNHVAAAYLHDVLEDIDSKEINAFSAAHDTIFEQCGRPVLEMVLWLTNASLVMSGSREERKAADRLKLRTAPVDVKVIKLVDRIDNLVETRSDIERGLDKNLEFALKYARESRLLWHEALAGSNKDLENELDAAITQVEICAGWRAPLPSPQVQT